MEQITQSQIALFIWIVAAWLVCAYLAYNIITKEVLRLRVSESFDEISNKLKDFQERLLLIEPRGIEYINSLGSEGAKVLYDLRVRMSNIEEFIGEIERLRSINSRLALLQAQHLIDTAFIEHIVSRSNYNTKNLRISMEGVKTFSIPVDWELRIETLLQKLGKLIHTSSIRASRSGLKKRRDRQSTIQSLRQAGIKLMED